MKILIIDDQEVPAKNLALKIEGSIPNSTVVLHHMFDTAFSCAEKEIPDVVILDIFINPTSEEGPGDAVREQLWKSHFCPLIIYTARPQQQHRNISHPFVKLCEKTGKRQSDDEVILHLKNFAPHVDVLRNVRNEAIKTIGESLRLVCDVIWKDPDSNQNDKRAELIGRVTKRRVAASMDISSAPNSLLRPWEQYIYPPISTDLLTGDVLAFKEGYEPANYGVVISPSCDLVQRNGCLKNILVACCESVNGFLQAAQLLNAKHDTLKKRLPSYLTADQISGFICLPELPDVFPVMAINLKNLRLIDLATVKVQVNQSEYPRRLASVDSPFRERIAFAFTQVAGRPGLPDIDRAQFIESIVKISVPITAQPGCKNAVSN